MSIEPYQLNKETLESLVQKYSLRQIAKLIGKSDVSYYLNKWNIQVPEERRHKTYTPIDMETLKREAECGTDAKVLAEKYGWSYHSIYHLYKKWNIHPMKKGDDIRKIDVSDEQKQIVIGSLLGDGSISKQGRLTLCHGSKQIEYLMWKVLLMSPFMSKISLRHSIDKRSGKLNAGWVSYSTTHSYFKEMWGLFYPHGKKVFPDLTDISPLSLAIWYMDDGTYTQEYGFSYLCTQCFTEDENHKIANLLSNQYHINTKVHHAGQGKFRIGMNRDASMTLFSIVGRFIHPSLMYKMGRKGST